MAPGPADLSVDEDLMQISTRHLPPGHVGEYGLEELVAGLPGEARVLMHDRNGLEEETRVSFSM